MAMLARMLVRFALVTGAAWWLVRVVFSRAGRGRLDRAMQAIDEATGSVERH